MPKKLTDEYFATLIHIVAKFPNGALLGQIKESIANCPPQRTLQNHLSKLVKMDHLTRSGKGVATRYYLPIRFPDKKIYDDNLETKKSTLPLSPEALVIKKKVTASIVTRNPVGYNRSFIDDYIPNRTYYLSKEIRNSLHSLGSLSEATEPAGTYLRELYNRVLIDFSWNSSRLEGNTYSLLETELLLDIGESVEGKDAKEAQMILNHKDAIELLCEQADDIGFNRYTICNLHAVLSDNLLTDPQACGRVRTKGVGITGTVFHPLEVPQMIEECFDSLLNKASAIDDAFEQAFFVMVHIPYLQPFEDVNKRVSRLAANIPFVRMNLCPLSFVDVPEHDYTEGTIGVYELNRVEYLRDVFVWAYQRSCARYSAVRQSLGEPDEFRLKHRSLIKKIVHNVVQASMLKKKTVTFIRSHIPDTLSDDDQKHLMEIVETELSCLHEGNIARYQLKPSEYKNWTKSWL